jgi:type IV secretory pathway component VirB8
MNDMIEPPPSVFLPRPTSTADLAVALAAVRQTDSERRVGNIVLAVSGWLVAAAMVVPLGYCLSIIKNRPVPQDRIYTALIHDDHTIEPAKPIEDMTVTERENTITQFMGDYVDYRVSYDAEHIKRNYDRTRFTTMGDAQKEYIALMTTDPDRPTETLGLNGERRVGDVTVSRVGGIVGEEAGAFEVLYTVKIKPKQGQWLQDLHRRARISFTTSKNMPAEIARRIDPLKLVTTRWSDHDAAYTETGASK